MGKGRGRGNLVAGRWGGKGNLGGGRGGKSQGQTVRGFRINLVEMNILV